MELGPGRTLGVGIAARLSGVDRYVALDAFAITDAVANARVRDELVELFQTRAPIPGDDEFPDVQPHLRSYAFPAELCAPFTPQRVAAAVAPDAVEYYAPWMTVAPTVGADLALSQATMFLVTDPARVYRRLGMWLKAGGVMSHTLNFTSQGMTPVWNGHWTMTPRLWRARQRRRMYYYGQHSHSEHLQFLEASGCSILLDRCEMADSYGVTRADLARPFRHFTDDDLRIKRAVVFARKSPSGASVSDKASETIVD